jgi:hypothetical protein
VDELFIENDVGVPEAAPELAPNKGLEAPPIADPEPNPPKAGVVPVAAAPVLLAPNPNAGLLSVGFAPNGDALLVAPPNRDPVLLLLLLLLVPKENGLLPAVVY